ncbi:MAG: HlyD family efflux transporter periplasmic adaptor subunit [Tannerella sp.]|jgi:multidrug resistance efflux pump|nr:HlyD family efflux transporter periplasmic adaptor subunit [Tannerella sp.]
MKDDVRKDVEVSSSPSEKAGENPRSEEITDIVDRMPMNFGRWVSAAVVMFSSLLLLFGWIVKYPDTVTGHIRLNSGNAPVKLVANASGNLHLASFRPQDNVKKGDYIAVIDNPAVTDDVRNVAVLTGMFNPNTLLTDSVQRLFPEEISLGDLNLKYYSFLSSLKSKCDYLKDNVYEKQRISLLDDIRWKEHILDESGQILQTTQQKLDITKKWLDKYTSLNKDEIVTYEYEVDRSRSDYLTARQEEQSLRKEMASIKMQIAENQNRLTLLEVERKEQERKLQMDLLTAYQDLCDNIKAWEQKFVFKAPFDGKVEFLKFLSENQFIQTGEEVFGIVPPETDVFGQVLLPSTGAGKVKIGSKVTVKLDNFPYLEYGSIDGSVGSISLISQPQKTEQSTIETYLITVDLPYGLKTNYGEVLDFQYEIGGTADIIVNERRLIERLFDNLKYRTK